MGSKPKKQDYEASAAEKASAAVAKAEYDYFKQNYEPLLLEMRDKAQHEDYRSPIRGRANADVAQALSSAYTGAAKAWSTTDVGTYEDMGKAWIGQLTSADAAALDVKNTMSTGVLGTARKQAAEAQTGMAQASRLETSSLLNKAKTNQQVAQAKFDAGVSLAGATILGAADKYARNKSATTVDPFATSAPVGGNTNNLLDTGFLGRRDVINTGLDPINKNRSPFMFGGPTGTTLGLRR